MKSIYISELQTLIINIFRFRMRQIECIEDQYRSCHRTLITTKLSHSFPMFEWENLFQFGKWYTLNWKIYRDIVVDATLRKFEGPFQI